MDLLKAKQIKTLQERAENAFSSSSASNSDEDEHAKPARPAQRRTSAASEERWAATISSTPIGTSIWGSIPDQERGRASRSASFSVGQEFVASPFGASQSPAVGMSAAEARKLSSADDQTRVLREQLQQMKFKSRSKSSYAAAWHVPDMEDRDDGSDDVFLDEDDLVSRMRRGEPPGLRYTTPTNPRLGSLRNEQQRRASFNSGGLRPHELERPIRSPLSHESLRREGNSGLHDSSMGLRVDNSPRLAAPQPAYNDMMADVDRYFSSDDHRARTRAALAQSAAQQQQAQQLGMASDLVNAGAMQGQRQRQPDGPLYIVEFKACRTDVFHAADASLELRVGDLVLVEADRGRDLGKVVRENVTMAQVRALKAQQAKDQAIALGAAGGLMDGDGSFGGEEPGAVPTNIQPKLIYRHAQQQEIAMLLVKAQDEQQAMLVCQAKVRQRKLSMEVLDGEYQWDRRKLTFYYYATQRIDFRELVRDLFKIYKTRIWMCACNPTSLSNANLALGPPGVIGDAKGQDGASSDIGLGHGHSHGQQGYGGPRARPQSFNTTHVYSPTATAYTPVGGQQGFSFATPPSAGTPHAISPGAAGSPGYYGNAYVDTRGMSAQSHPAYGPGPSGASHAHTHPLSYGQQLPGMQSPIGYHQGGGLVYGGAAPGGSVVHPYLPASAAAGPVSPLGTAAIGGVYNAQPFVYPHPPHHTGVAQAPAHAHGQGQSQPPSTGSTPFGSDIMNPISALVSPPPVLRPSSGPEEGSSVSPKPSSPAQQQQQQQQSQGRRQPASTSGQAHKVERKVSPALPLPAAGSATSSTSQASAGAAAPAAAAGAASTQPKSAGQVGIQFGSVGVDD